MFPAGIPAAGDQRLLVPLRDEYFQQGDTDPVRRELLVGLAQFGLILGSSYELFSPLQMERAPQALQYVSIIGGAIMIVAGCLWVGYFRLLMKSKPVAKEAVRPTEIQPTVKAEAKPVMEKNIAQIVNAMEYSTPPCHPPYSGVQWQDSMLC